MPVLATFIQHSIGNLPNPGTEPGSPALQADSVPTELSGKPLGNFRHNNNIGKGDKSYSNWKGINKIITICRYDTNDRKH